MERIAWLDSSDSFIALFTNLSKAFVCLSHYLLLAKLMDSLSFLFDKKETTSHNK